MFDIYRHTYVAEALTIDRRRRFELDARNSRLVRIARLARRNGASSTGDTPTDTSTDQPGPAPAADHRGAPYSRAA